MTRRALTTLFTLLLISVSACDQAVATPTDTDIPDETALAKAAAESPTETSVAPAIATAVLVTISATEELISVTAADGLSIQTTLYAPGLRRPAPGVILLHMLGSNRAAWGPTGLIDALLADGFAVLTVDMRGHGETGGTADWSLAEDDLARVWTAFAERPEVDGKRTAVVGASIGANVALITAADQPAIRAAVLLSPGLDYRGVTTDDRLGAYGDRPLLIIASNEDGYAADSSRSLAELARGTAQLTLYDDAGHGTQMFVHEPGLAAEISAWLAEQLSGRSS